MSKHGNLESAIRAMSRSVKLFSRWRWELDWYLGGPFIFPASFYWFIIPTCRYRADQLDYRRRFFALAGSRSSRFEIVRLRLEELPFPGFETDWNLSPARKKYISGDAHSGKVHGSRCQFPLVLPWPSPSWSATRLVKSPRSVPGICKSPYFRYPISCRNNDPNPGKLSPEFERDEANFWIVSDRLWTPLHCVK